jgi:hypothetical protein
VAINGNPAVSGTLVTGGTVTGTASIKEIANQVGGFYVIFIAKDTYLTTMDPSAIVAGTSNPTPISPLSSVTATVSYASAAAGNYVLVVSAGYDQDSAAKYRKYVSFTVQ